MSDFLINLGNTPAPEDTVKQMQMSFRNRRPEGKCFEFSWGTLSVLEERFGKNLFNVDGAVVVWVGDLLANLSEDVLESLVRLARGVRSDAGGQNSFRSHAVLDQFNGSFAFVIADTDGFSVITDPMNYVQVYAATDSRGMVTSVGTQPDLVARVGGQAQSLDLTSLAEFLNAGTPLFPNTSYSNVKEIQPASVHTVACGNQGQRLSRVEYWSPPVEVREGYNEATLVDELREVLLAIIRARCQVGKAGVFLSGGLDSRLIMAAVPQTVECVGLTFANHLNRETRTARRVAACYQREWIPLIRDPDYLANCLLDAVKLTGCEYEWTCAQVIGVADALAPLGLDVILEGTLFNDYFTAFCAREWQLQKRWYGLFPSYYRKTNWDFLNQISGFWRKHFRAEVLREMGARRQATYDRLVDPRRGSIAEWLEIHPFTQDPTVGYYPAERRILPVRLVAMDRRALDFSFRCPIELKLGGRLYAKAACSIYGKGKKIPNANDGVRPGSGHCSRLAQRAIHEVKRKGTRFLARMRGRPQVPHSWHDYQRYWRESARLRNLCQHYGPNLDEFDGVLIEGRGRELLANLDLHWEYGFRLLQLAVWRELQRGCSTASSAPSLGGVEALPKVASGRPVRVALP
jgi:hypothetical protein